MLLVVTPEHFRQSACFGHHGMPVDDGLRRRQHSLPRLRDDCPHPARRHAEPHGEVVGGDPHEPRLSGEHPEPRRGAFVVGVTEQGIKDIYDCRLL